MSERVGGSLVDSTTVELAQRRAPVVMPRVHDPMTIPAERYRDGVSMLPLVSVDTVIEREDGRVLLGLRRNRPAQGYWFVPGCAIRKNERIGLALTRVLRTELGFVPPNPSWEFLGLYEHWYEDNAFDEQVSTHYVVLAHRLRWSADWPQPELDAQHADWLWLHPDELLQRDDVHPYTQAYFDPAIAQRWTAATRDCNNSAGFPPSRE